MLCDRLAFDFHAFYIGSLCSTVKWTYSGESCNPVLFILQGFQLEQLTSNHLSSPTFSLNSTVPIYTLIRSQVVNENLYYRSFSVNEEGQVCTTSSLQEFFNFTMVSISGKFFSSDIATTISFLLQDRMFFAQQSLRLLCVSQYQELIISLFLFGLSNIEMKMATAIVQLFKITSEHVQACVNHCTQFH